MLHRKLYFRIIFSEIDDLSISIAVWEEHPRLAIVGVERLDVRHVKTISWNKTLSLTEFHLIKTEIIYGKNWKYCHKSQRDK